MDNKTNIQQLKDKVQLFCEQRDWDQFHNPKDLAIGIITEASELLEHFRFKSEEEMKAMFEKKNKKQAIEEEVADIFFFLLRFAQMNNINIAEQLERKIELNDKKYPVEKFRGSNKKYSEVEE
jgi:NTP pyrophosphatase (non-canonical NTP hydrolase)